MNASTSQPLSIPYSEEAEQATLGALMIDYNDEAWDKIADVIQAVDFYQPAHRLIFNAAAELAAQQQPTDVITLSQKLDSKKQLEKAGGQPYLAHLALQTPTSANALAYAEIVRDLSLLREMIKVGTNIVERAQGANGDTPQTLLDQAEVDIFSIAERADGRRDVWASARDAARAVNVRLQALSDPLQRKAFEGLQTPWQAFNDKTNGFQKGDLIIIAGRPSMGKTTFAMNFASHLANQGKVVGVFSVEMGADQLMTRLLAAHAQVSLNQFNKGSLKNSEWYAVEKALKEINNWQLMIDESATLSPMDVRSRARRLMKQQGGLDVIIVDYLQLMTSGQRTENRVQEVAQISRALKALAKELNIPIIALSQLSRKTMDREDKRPILSDLRESGAIEQDADMICFVHRPEMLETDESKKDGIRGKAEIIIGKHRNGETGVVPLRFSGAYNQFRELEEEIEECSFTTI